MLLFTGVSALECRQCWGDEDDCNNKTANIQVCSDGQDRCSAMTVKRDGKEERLYGCATENDCSTGVKSCKTVEGGTARASCHATCCGSALCNNPPAEGTTQSLEFKLTFMRISS